MAIPNNLADNSKRIWSFAIDDLVISMLFIFIYFEQLEAIRTVEEASLFIRSNYWELVLLKVLYHTFFTWQNGMTLGKHIMKIRVVSLDSTGTLSLPMAFLRSAVRILDEAFFYIGFLPAFFSTSRQTLHDRVSRSIVVNV